MIDIAVSGLDHIFFVHVKQSDVCLKRETTMLVVIGKLGWMPMLNVLIFGWPSSTDARLA